MAAMDHFTGTTMAGSTNDEWLRQYEGCSMAPPQYYPPPTDAGALTAYQRTQPVLREYDPGVAPWYDGRWELPGR